MKISIIGAGIAGLTTAIALKKAGFETEVFEAASEIKPVGAGLGLAPNAIKAFYELGIAEKIIPLGRRLPHFKITNAAGSILSFTDSQAISARYGIDNFTIHRYALHQALLQELDGTPIYIGKKVIGLTKEGKELIIQFQDGSSHKTPYLIIADGIHSVLRNKLVPHATIRYAGYSCWRAVIEGTGIAQEGASETWDTAGRFGIVPLKDNQIYWFACINAPEKSEKFKNFRVQDLYAHFHQFHAPVPQILSKTKDEQLLHHDIFDLDPLPHFVYDNVLLVGDTAHGMTPNMGQGACQAIEDAVVLGKELERNTTIEAALQAFERRRLKRTEKIILRSRNIGRIAQTSNPILAGIRNAMLRITPASAQTKQFDMLYNIDF
ncbi:monooxygenase [Adhaeribacter arboris]|uniref:Monooxygenase n=1 Tax=Adhaeribacter arboris TaxID=2072846 RepID=A0A2T2Y8R4_9BACT|nr:FAD-dependent monooxygenase [Adhaeribacter arboris]PSR51897.1 monooxygenase [Adhaeribacter arboris]